MIERESEILFPDMCRLGFGCGDMFGGSAHDHSARLIETALDSGICYFDVARLYGNGTAEKLLGSILPKVRDRVIIASKAGIMPWSMRLGARIVRKATTAARAAGGPLARNLIQPPAPAAARSGAFGISELRRSIEQSLRDLRTDYLDILLLHECSVEDACRDDIVEFLMRLREAGKIRRYGVATSYSNTVDILRRLPPTSSIVQFASDALNRNLANLSEGRPDLIITHSAIKHVLPHIVARLASDTDAAARWNDRFGIAPNDSEGLVRLLLANALTENAGGIVLFSSSRPERLRRTVELLSSDIGLPGLQQEVARLRSASSA